MQSGYVRAGAARARRTANEWFGRRAIWVGGQVGSAGMCGRRASDPGGVLVGLAHEHGGGLAVERVGGVWVEQQLRQEDLEDVEEVCGWPVGRAGGVSMRTN
eukprot:3949671-Pleurochrysis_carterae.AAC.1